jgi:GLPGLI family protein
MKKVIIFMIIYSCTFQLTGQNNNETFTANYRVTYRLEYYSDSTNIDNKLLEDFYLFIGEDKSKFISRNKWIKDSILSTAAKNFNGSHIDMSKRKTPKTKFYEIILKDYKNKQIKVSDRIAGDVFLYTENIAPYVWEVKKDKKTVNEFKVQKAITNFAGREYEAWFTEEIPITQGPYKFDGLPGLIIQISDTENHYNYQLISFKKLKAKKGIEDFDNNKNYIKTTKEQLHQIKQDFFDDPISRIPFDLTPEAKRRIKEKYKKRNNPIELE